MQEPFKTLATIQAYSVATIQNSPGTIQTYSKGPYRGERSLARCMSSLWFFRVEFI